MKNTFDGKCVKCGFWKLLNDYPFSSCQNPASVMFNRPTEMWETCYQFKSKSENDEQEEK